MNIYGFCYSSSRNELQRCCSISRGFDLMSRGLVLVGWLSAVFDPPHTGDFTHSVFLCLPVSLRQGQPMYSIPPGGFRHPYPALAMNASMSR